MDINKELEDTIIKEHTINKLCAYAIGKKYSIKGKKIVSLLKINNIFTPKRSGKKRFYQLDDNYFNIIDTEDKAYFLGLLFADGCNLQEENTVILQLSDEDKNILEKFRSYIKSNKPLRLYQKSLKNPRWKDIAVLEIISKQISINLTKLGCMPRKTFKLKFPLAEQVPTHLLNHFIRGYFDGDGCITYFFNKGKYLKCTVSIVSTSDFVNKLGALMKKEIGINCYINQRFPGRNNNNRTLNISGNIQCCKFMNWIYNDKNTFLQRKWDKYQKFLEIYNQKLKPITSTSSVDALPFTVVISNPKL